MTEKKRSYMDHAATTPVDPQVVRAMEPYFTEIFGNPSSLHSFGREAYEALEKSRETVSGVLGCSPEEVYFTSGGTESDNLAIKGVAYANKNRGNHIITSAIEHHAVLHTCQQLEKEGFRVTYLPVDEHGLVDPDDLEKAITEKTILASIMHANNEIGTIEPLKELGEVTKKKKIYFHTDAVQTYGKIPTDVNKLGVDLLSMSSHKLYGPKGVGGLYIKRGVKIKPIQHGGGHESGMRSGTENVTGIVGYAKASELARKHMKERAEKEIKLRDKLIEGVLRIEDSRLNGHPTNRLPNNTNFCFKYIEGESMLLYLDEKGIAASTGSACSSKNLEPSHVLLAIGLKHEEAHGSLRLTLGKDNTKEEVEYVLAVLPEVVGKLREISPYKRGYN